MASPIRIKDISRTVTTAAANEYLAVEGPNGSGKMLTPDPRGTATTAAAAAVAGHDGNAGAHGFALSGVAISRYFPQRSALAGNFHGTLVNRFPCPRKFRGFTVTIPSGDSVAVKYTYAISANPADDGAGLTWKAVKFAGSDTVTRSTASEMTSDLITEVLDSSANVWIFVRAYAATMAYFDVSDGADFPANVNRAFGDFAQAGGRSTSDLSSGGALAVNLRQYAEWGVLGFNFYGPHCFSLYGVGDSLDQGWSTNSGNAVETSFRYTAQHAANYLLNAGYSCGWQSIAKAGRAHATSMDNVYAISTFRQYPDFIALRPWSPNSGYTSADFAKCEGETNQALRKIRSFGARAVLVSPTPVYFTGQAEANRLSAVSYAMAAKSVINVDASTLVMKPGENNRIRTDYLDLSGNEVHMNDAGYKAVGDAIGSAIAAAIAAT